MKKVLSFGKIASIIFCFIVADIIISCSDKNDCNCRNEADRNWAEDSRPYCRYWWFASEIQKEDIRYNLNWLKKNGFGGVEIAWVYPLNRSDKSDTSYTPRQEWLSPEWMEIVGFAQKYADSIGLGCDMTFGTLWPFGDSYVDPGQAARRFEDKRWRQTITASWEYPDTGYVIDHLNAVNYMPYFERLIEKFPFLESKIRRAYFIDSWEVETERLWTEGFENDFMDRFSYDIRPFMADIYSPENRDYLYDYMSLISDKVIRFYQDYDNFLNEQGLISRGQCSGAPCDIISAYSKLDVPEGEAALYEPEYNSIPASAAALSGKRTVSAETFTCLYGWPRNYIRQEQTADLKMLADALFANGINQIVWHGKPHNPAGTDSVSFYASVHVGPDGNLAEEIPEFNRYLTRVSSLMKKGKTFARTAVYLPAEDARIKGTMPVEQQFIWAWGYYEMRYIYFPREIRNSAPLWINKEFLLNAKVDKSRIISGDMTFDLLYIDVSYLDYETLRAIYNLALQGADIVMKNIPIEPGINKHCNFTLMIEKILALGNVKRKYYPGREVFISGENIPPYWSRIEDETVYIFFANPKSGGLKFPISYGQSFTNETIHTEITVQCFGREYGTVLEFKPYQSILLKLNQKGIENIDIEFVPKTPIVKDSSNMEKPWLVRK